jgi:hypothetical protein
MMDLQLVKLIFNMYIGFLFLISFKIPIGESISKIHV